MQDFKLSGLLGNIYRCPALFETTTQTGLAPQDDGQIVDLGQGAVRSEPRQPSQAVQEAGASQRPKGPTESLFWTTASPALY